MRVVPALRVSVFMALALGVVSPAIAAKGKVSVWQTSADGAQKLARQPDIALSTPPVGGAVIKVDATREFQTVEGFGASFTDASSWLIRNHLTDRQRRDLLRELFDRKSGLGLNLTRLTIGASDFSQMHYSYNDLPAGQTDPEMRQFSLVQKDGADVIPMVRQALAINPRLRVFAAPWSAPAWMKSSGSLIKGRLKPEHYPAYARYLVRYTEAMKAQGVPIYALSMQNEPHFEPANYPGMRVEASERADFVAGHLGPLFTQRRLKTRILDWDHNWEQPESPLGFFARADAGKYAAGTAWHCYGGDVSAQSKVHDAHPDKETWLTECSSGSWATDFGESLQWQVKNLIIGATRHWAKGVILWNLALDEKAGPHLGGCGNCSGVVTINRATGAITRNAEYYALGHASKFVRPGARRIASDSGIEGVETVAFLNPGSGGIVLIAVNTSKEPRELAVRSGPATFPLHLQAGAVVSLLWQQ